MAYASKNPRLSSIIATDLAAAAGTNAPSGAHRWVNRNGQLWARSSGGVESYVGGGSSLNITAGYTVTDTDGVRRITATTAPSTLTFSSRSSDTVTFTGAHGMVTGTPIQFTGSGTICTGLTNYSLYYAIVTSSTACKFATSIANALAGTAVTLSGDGSGTRTWTCGVGVMLPTAADNPGRVISIGLTYAAPAQMLAIIPEASGETIDGLTGLTLAFSADRVTIYCDGTKWYALSEFYTSYYQNFGYAVANDIASGWLAIVRRGSAVNLSGVWTMDGAVGSTTQSMSNILPTWARPSGSTLGQLTTASTSTGYLYRAIISTSGTITLQPLDIDTNGDLGTATFSAAEDVVFGFGFVKAS